MRLYPALFAASLLACGSSMAPDDAATPRAGAAGTPTDASPKDAGPTDASSPPGEVVVEARGGSFICHPAGAGPFGGIVYNHGGLGDMVGGDLRGTCVALAEAGYVGYAKLRRATVSLAGHIDDVLDALDELLGMPDVDRARIGMLGFSRGGLLALQAATLRSELDAVVVMAPAPGNGALDRVLMNADQITAPVLLLVSENDMNPRVDHVAVTATVEAELSVAGVDVTRRVLPPFTDGPMPGHSLFFEVRPEYWAIVMGFFDARF